MRPQRYWFYIFIFCSKLLAQDPVYRTINNLNGLSSNTVYNLLQDKEGFIWMAHDKGLTRYDGVSFTSFKSASLQSKSLSNLMEVGGTVYCQDFAGNCYRANVDQQQLKIVFNTPGSYATIGEIQKNIIVSVKSDSVRSYDVSNNQYRSIYYSGFSSPSIFFDTTKAYFLSTSSIISFDGTTLSTELTSTYAKEGMFYLIKIGDQFFGFTKNVFPYAYAISSTGAKSIGIGLPKGIFIQDISIIDKEIWINTSTGAYCFDFNFRPLYGGKCFFSDASISKVIKDREGSYWFSTLNKGVFHVANINTVLYPYKTLGLTAVTKMNDTHLLVGTTNNEVLQFSVSDNNYALVYKQPSNHEVIDVFYDSLQSLIAASSYNLLLLNKQQKVAAISIASKKVVSLHPSRLYAVAYASGISLVKNGGSLQLNDIPVWLRKKGSLLESNVYKIQLPTGRCRSVAYDKNSRTLYAATANGLSFISPNGDGQVTYQQEAIYAAQLLQTDSILIAATFAQGVFVISNKKVVRRITTNGSAIYKAYEQNGTLWLIGDDVLIRHELTANKSVYYTAADGLPKAEFKDIVVVNDHLYIATSLGLLSFSTNASFVNKVPPLLKLNSITINGASVPLRDQMQLSASENDIGILFSVLSFKGENNVRVQYKINNGDWVVAETGVRKITLPSLSAGNYSVFIRALNEDGVPSSEVLKQRFTVAAPFYRKIWFLLGLGAISSIGVYIYFKTRLRRAQRQNELMSQKVELEKALQQSMLASIKSQMNPHFLFNALNTIQSYIYTNDKEHASEYLGKFSELTRLILEMSNLPTVSLATEIKALQLYLSLEQQRFDDKLHCSFKIDEALDTETIQIPSMIIQPYIENAIKHGLLHSKNVWQLSIQFKRTNTGILVEIDDNGIGRKRSNELNSLPGRKYQSFSSLANGKRLSILNEGLSIAMAVEIIDKVDSQGIATGTLVKLHIPLLGRAMAAS